MLSKKTLWTVVVDNYFPELMKYTLPSLERWASKIGADFRVISERKFPDFPPTYEKLQIHELGKNCEWNILLDADVMLDPRMPDFTQVVPPESLAFYMEFDASLLFEPDPYFVRHGKRLGVATNFVIAHHMIHDIWTPLEFGWEQAKTKTKREFIVDEYCISRNLARFGLKHTGLLEGETEKMFHHFDINTVTPDRESVVAEAKKLAQLWENV